MEEIYLSNNSLTHLCRGFGNLTKLKVLDLSSNQLTELSKEIGWLGKSMRKLLLRNNRMKAVPGDLYFLNRAVQLDLSTNPLTTPFVQWYDDSLVTLMDNLIPYLRAYPPNCIVKGDGLTSGEAGMPSQFEIIAKDFEDNDRINGGDSFEAVYVGQEADGTEFQQKAIVKDTNSGVYSCFYNFKRSGKFKVQVTECLSPIKGSPFDAYISPGKVDPTRCELDFAGLDAAKVGNLCSCIVIAKDRFGNKHEKGGVKFAVEIKGPNGAAPRPLVKDESNGLYTVSFTPGWPGNYTVSSNLDGVTLPGCPRVFDVKD